MKRLKYECDDCEDIEIYDEVLEPDAHCVCGGHLFLVRRDHYSPLDIPICDTCANKGTDECIDCILDDKLLADVTGWRTK